MKLLPKMYIVACSISYLFTCPVFSEEAESPPQTLAAQEQQVDDAKTISQDILSNYLQNYYQLDIVNQGHFSLRLYRQTLNKQFLNGVNADLYRITDNLNRIAEDINTPEKIYLYSQKHLAKYKNSKDVRSQIRYDATKNTPEYFFLGPELIGSLARLNEYGLEHVDNDALRKILHNYDFKRFVTDKNMMKAWAAQLANQVFWLKQLGEHDYTSEFISTFRETYPDSEDKNLTRQQYENKIYGLTHIILADSMYYQRYVDPRNYSWIFDYFRANMSTLLLRAKADILAEIGISFLLTNQSDDPVVSEIRQALIKKYDPNKRLIPSSNGSDDIPFGEHRNVLAIMFLNWQQPNAAPNFQKTPEPKLTLPFGVHPKTK
ncbi:DUF3541 domain-containing protein [Vibrio viridaestus]|uniref:DUF3541 domain-containing protein n=1 Tax=Vibrio viridaestus TaxID=2487322 RepID=A0A3N9TM24_9VIBR|nr:DUF3541 domain-containing protein [Vibrio viridaestus]RQW64893.1 DUF3541 domain-containing protein [Vibrio viridaestus]